MCQHTSYQFVGTDAQVELEENHVGYTGGGLEVERGSEEQMKTKWYHEEKRSMLMNFMIEWKLAAANTFGSRQVAHIPYNKDEGESVGLHACSDAFVCSGSETHPGRGRTCGSTAGAETIGFGVQ